MKGLRLAAVGALLFVILAAGAYAVRARQGLASLVPAISSAPVVRAPDGVRIRVQVLNTTKTRGLARRATKLLRDRGFDVVEMGTAGPALETTLVLDRSGHAAWASTAAQVLGSGARSEARPDSSRYLDVTVMLGRTWRAPAQPLDP